ncbi:hypothetical protein OPV22_008756 [Ensete ventricosum]|uniref:Uncharacterized protein n=1 Tax=Ensete ventricosum TaxID=4639 RepID=A0AAV8PQI3_ENSVE|nr:hypothetical protein OPV22_008756 [Ensete ventricosum]
MKLTQQSAYGNETLEDVVDDHCILMSKYGVPGTIIQSCDINLLIQLVMVCGRSTLEKCMGRGYCYSPHPVHPELLMFNIMPGHGRMLKLNNSC